MKKNITVIEALNNGTAKFRETKPLQVEVRNGDLNGAIKVFNSMVQREKVLATYKEKQFYEKPSDRKRRKKREAQEKQRILNRKFDNE